MPATTSLRGAGSRSSDLHEGFQKKSAMVVTAGKIARLFTYVPSLLFGAVHRRCFAATSSSDPSEEELSRHTGQEMPLAEGAKRADLQSMFALVHGDCTGSLLNHTATPEEMIAYIRRFICDMRERKEGAKISEQSLTKLDRELSDTLQVEQLKRLCGDDSRMFGIRFLRLLREQKKITVISGYAGAPPGHCVFISFRWCRGMVSAEVIDRGGGNGGTHRDIHGRERIFAKRTLRPCPSDRLKEHSFWRLLLDVEKSGAENPSGKDFYGTVLPEWPGGKGKPHGKEYKPQYEDSCVFSGFKTVLEDLLPDRETKFFLLALAADTLRKYAEDPHADRCLVKSAIAHLSRRIIKYEKERKTRVPALHEEVRLIEMTEERRAVEGRPGRNLPFPLSKPFEDPEADQPVSIGREPALPTPPTAKELPTVDPLRRLQRYYEGNTNEEQRASFFRYALAEIPPFEDAIWTNPEGKELFDALCAVREDFHKREGRIDPNEAALIFIVDMIRLKRLLPILKKHKHGSRVCDFYVMRMQNVSKSSRLDLFRPTHPDIVPRFMEAARYLDSLTGYEGGEGELLTDNTFSSIHDKRIDIEAPHIAYLRETLTDNLEAEKQFTEWRTYRLRNGFGGRDIGTDITAMTMWAWGRLHVAGSGIREIEQLGDLQRLDLLWSNFFVLFHGTNRAYPTLLPELQKSFHRGSHVMFKESLVSGRVDKHPFLATYPGLQTEDGVNPLRWVLSKRQPEESLPEEMPEALRTKLLQKHEKAGENAHLLHGQAVEVNGRTLSRAEIEGLWNCTAEKTLAIDTIIMHFNRFPQSLEDPSFRSVLVALLTQTFHMRKQGEGRCETKRCHLLLRAVHHDPGQLIRLIAFAKERGRQAANQGLLDQTRFFLYVEGLALAYFMRTEGYEEAKGEAYADFVERAGRLLRSETYADETGSVLLQLATYFERTSKGEEFTRLLTEVHTFVCSENPQERGDTLYGYAFHASHRPKRVAPRSEIRVIDTYPFAGVYRKCTLTQRDPILDVKRLDCYVLQSDDADKKRYLFFRQGKRVPDYTYDGTRFERLDSGRPTGQFLVRGSAHTGEQGAFFARIASPEDLFLWRNGEGKIVSVEYRNRECSFNLIGGRWMSDTHPGYFLDEDPTCPLFEPATHYLLLRNEEGDRIVYVPDRPLKVLDHSPSLFDPPVVECEGEGSSLFVYHLDEKGEIDPSNVRPEEITYALLLALRVRNFARADRLLTLLKGNAYPLNREAARLLYDAIDGVPVPKDPSRGIAHKIAMIALENRPFPRDRNPQSVALRIRIILLILDDPATASFIDRTEKERVIRLLTRDLRSYHMQANNVFPLILTAEERASAEQWTRKTWIDRLTEDIVDVFVVAEKESMSTGEGVRDLNLKNPSGPPKTTNALRPSALASEFLSYYAVARHASKEDAMRKEIAFLAGSSAHAKGGIRTAATILEAVSRNPDRFPTVESIKKCSGAQRLTMFSHMWERCKPTHRLWWVRLIVALVKCVVIRLWISLIEPRPHREEEADPASPFLKAPSGTEEKGSPPQGQEVEFGLHRPPLAEGLPGMHMTLSDKSEERRIASEIREHLRKECEEDSRSEPCLHEEVGRLIRGAEAIEERARDLRAQEIFTVLPERADELKGEIGRRIADKQYRSDEERGNIMALSSTYPEEMQGYVRGNILVPLSLDELIIAFGRGDDERIRRSNPSLTSDEIRRLKERIGEYLLLENEKRRLTKAREALHAGRLEEAASILRHEPSYVPHEERALLVFEHVMGLHLRREQVTFLRRLVPPSSAGTLPPSLLEEARTGFGKSKVAIPLWIALTTSPDRLTMLTVPQALLEETRKQMSHILGKAFDQSIRVIRFAREDLHDVSKLRTLRLRLEEARNEGKAVLLSVGTLHGISVLMHKEAIAREGTDRALSQEHMEEMDRIRVLLARASNFMDESSEALYVGFSYDYAFGDKCALTDDYIEDATTIYELLLSDEVLQQFSPDFLTNGKEGKPLSAEVYREELLPLLVKRVLDRLEVPEEYREGAEKSLLGGYDEMLCDPYFKTLTPAALKRFAVLREQLTAHLPASLSMRWNERYVLGEKRIAYPAKYGVRVPEAQFSSVGLVLNCTVQANLRNRFTQEDLEAFLEEVRALSLREKESELPFNPIYAALQRFTGHTYPNPNMNGQEKATLLRTINDNSLHRLVFTSAFILPKFRYSPETLTSYPQLLVDRFGSFQGASGTLTRNMPDALPLRFDETASFANLIPLWRDAQDRVYAVSDAKGIDLVDELFSKYGEGHNVLIDVAGYLRDISSGEEIARAILERTDKRNPPIDGVEYMEKETGRRLILKRYADKPVLRELCPMEKDRVFTFYGQDAAIGLDIDLADNSRALVTVGRHTGKNFFLQGVGRLRGLRSGMSASFILANEDMKEVKKTLGIDAREALSFKDLFVHLVRKEAERQGNEALDVLEREWLAEIETLFLEGTRHLSRTIRGQLFRMLKPLFCETAFVHPVRKLRVAQEVCTAEEVINRKRMAMLTKLRSCISSSYTLSSIYGSYILRSMYDMEKLEESMNKKVKREWMRSRYLCDSGCTRRMAVAEAESERETERETECFVSENSEAFTPAVPLPFPTAEKPYTDIDSYTPLKTYISKGGLFCSPNFSRISEEGEQGDDKIKGAYYFLLIRTRPDDGSSEEDSYEMVLLDHHDAGHIKREMDKGGVTRDPRKDYYLCSSDKMAVLGYEGTPLEREPATIDRVKRLMIDARPRTKHLTYDRQEVKMIGESENAEAFLDFLREHFASTSPEAAGEIERCRKRVQDSSGSNESMNRRNVSEAFFRSEVG